MLVTENSLEFILNLTLSLFTVFSYWSYSRMFYRCLTSRDRLMALFALRQLATSQVFSSLIIT